MESDIPKSRKPAKKRIAKAASTAGDPPPAPITTGQDLRNKEMSYAQFAGNDLSGSNFSGTRLSHANFRGCRLSGVNFSGANLQAADFENADLSGASLSTANVRNARFVGVEGLTGDARDLLASRGAIVSK
ncbi:MAG TPA: pentapeptide repeat-containing protein [Thermoanaerobaculia bacterium]|nr:pentapeptide repeat-containing protein [Thermoanaerobaculia bacterium]